MARVATVHKVILLILLFGWVVGSQVLYDFYTPRQKDSNLPSVVSPSMIRLADLGFHATVASFYWVPTMPEILDLFKKKDEYIADLAFVNQIDPKLSYPYAFSVLTLPAVPRRIFPEAVPLATEIGLRGLAAADPDWRIPYYMATNYYLELKDKKSAQYYYDIAARTPGVPVYAQRFSLNFGIGSNERDRTRRLWESIRDTTEDKLTKARAQAYIDRLQMFDYLEAAAKIYRKKFGKYPAAPDDLVAAGIIPAVPEDPFQFAFVINADGTAGIDLNKLPAYFTGPNE